jgi:hypothetical protein
VESIQNPKSQIQNWLTPKMSTLENFTPQETQDGSFTFFSTEFNEAFHRHYGAK